MIHGRLRLGGLWLGIIMMWGTCLTAQFVKTRVATWNIGKAAALSDQIGGTDPARNNQSWAGKRGVEIAYIEERLRGIMTSRFPDVICLQEVSNNYGREGKDLYTVISEVAAANNYFTANAHLADFRPSSRFCMTLVRRDLTLLEVKQLSLDGWLPQLRTVLKTWRGGKMLVVNVHGPSSVPPLPEGQTKDVREKFFTVLSEAVTAAKNEGDYQSLVLAGDFNIGPSALSGPEPAVESLDARLNHLPLRVQLKWWIFRKTCGGTLNANTMTAHINLPWYLDLFFNDTMVLQANTALKGISLSRDYERDQRLLQGIKSLAGFQFYDLGVNAWGENFSSLPTAMLPKELALSFPEVRYIIRKYCDYGFNKSGVNIRIVNPDDILNAITGANRRIDQIFVAFPVAQAGNVPVTIWSCNRLTGVFDDSDNGYLTRHENSYSRHTAYGAANMDHCMVYGEAEYRK